MWKGAAGHDIKVETVADDDDWETDPDFVNDVTEQEQRWGAKTVEGSGRQGSINIGNLRDQVKTDDAQKKHAEYEAGPKASHGYGGNYGVEADRMDKVSEI
ncbi:hematopoietic lineage cell-specific protein-like [Saccoglossus kowalevskii]|uniref:Hematopoietic lineage cell-specific protein-like n=1 Tax=Saccoglossus kowalevskii TaxID=10224 RepID=A0ABM0M5I2_SACKO|nr:PREDICTED: hematopoietic lineage cell-specific protein-like [Saccoglossus kowalevskii]